MAKANLFRSLISPIYNKEMLKREREDEISDRVRAIAGRKGYSGPTQSGLPMQGTGLIGGEYGQEEYFARLAAEPGYGPQGVSGLLNMNNNQQAMARQKQQQAHYGENMNAYQRGGLQNQQQQMEATQQMAQAQMQFNQQQAMQKQQMEYQKYLTGQEQKQFGEYVPLMQQKRETVRMAKKANDSLPRHPNGAVDWSTASEDGTIAHQAVVTLAKSILPNEAVMTDDQGNIRESAGYPGWLNSMVASLKGATMGPDQLEQIFTRLNANARADMGTLDQLRSDAQARPGGGRGLPSRVEFNPLQAGGVQERATPQMPNDVVEVRGGRNYGGRNR